MTDDEIRMLSNELSGDRAFEHIRILSQWHRNSGMDGYFKAADYIMKEAKAAGTWYYGTVKLADVAGLLDAAVASGALELGRP